MKRTVSLQVWRRFAPLLLGHRCSMAAVLVASLAVAALEVIRPWTIAWLFDEALLPATTPRYEPEFVLWTSVAALLGIVGLRIAIDYLKTTTVVAVGHSVTRKLRHELFGHLIQLGPGFHHAHKSGDLLVRLMGDVPMLKSMMVDSTVELFSRVLLIATVLGVMFWKDTELTITLCIAVPAFVLVVRWIASRITIAVRKQRRKEGQLADYLHEAIAGSDAIQSLGRSDHVVHEFARSNRRSVRAGMKVAKLSARLGASVESMIVLATAVTLYLGGARVLEGRLSPGELLVFLSYVRSLLKPIRAASKHSERISKGTACGERIAAVLDASVEVTEKRDAQVAPKQIRSLSFEGVSHSYAGSRALNDINVEFQSGGLTGLYGASGAGKSTLAALTVRLFDPSEGVVRINGIDLRSLRVASLRERIGLCLQENILFGETIAENLALGEPESSREDMWRALEEAGAASFVRSLEDGIDTVLGSQGKGLSGGERRRLVLARTFLRKAPVLIVDEPFSGLDREAATKVRDTLSQYAQDRLVIVIAHEREHLSALDRVVFLESGNLTGEGTHDELLSKNERYRSMIGQSVGARS